MQILITITRSVKINMMTVMINIIMIININIMMMIIIINILMMRKFRHTQSEGARCYSARLRSLLRYKSTVTQCSVTAMHCSATAVHCNENAL